MIDEKRSHQDGQDEYPAEERIWRPVLPPGDANNPNRITSETMRGLKKGPLGLSSSVVTLLRDNFNLITWIPYWCLPTECPFLILSVPICQSTGYHYPKLAYLVCRFTDSRYLQKPQHEECHPWYLFSSPSYRFGQIRRRTFSKANGNISSVSIHLEGGKRKYMKLTIY